jgi:hypothetical protein
VLLEVLAEAFHHRVRLDAELVGDDEPEVPRRKCHVFGAGEIPEDLRPGAFEGSRHGCL